MRRMHAGKIGLWMVTGLACGVSSPEPLAPQPPGPGSQQPPVAGTPVTEMPSQPVAENPYAPPPPAWPGASEPAPSSTPTPGPGPTPAPTRTIGEALGVVPSAVSENYVFALSRDRSELTIDPRPRATRRARDISGGFEVRDSKNGGKVITLFGGPFRDGEWVRSSFIKIIKGEGQLGELRRAGYDLDQERDLLVVRGERDAEVTVFAFSADPAKPGIVGVCSQVTVVDFDKTSPMVAVRKPVIYVYPEARTRVRVEVDIDGEFVAVYPAMRDGGWTVMAEPSGDLVDEATGRRHRYLFWDGLSGAFDGIDDSRAHLVKGEDAAGFLEEACERFAFNNYECGDFMTYWLPELRKNKFNVVEFVEERRYEKVARMTVVPRADTVVRAFMLFRGSDVPVAVGEPELPRRERRGFTVVEWGGADLGRSEGRVVVR